MAVFTNSRQTSRWQNETQQARLSLLTELLLGRFEELQDCLGFELSADSRSYYGCCPIHGGDNTSGLTIYRDGDIPGKWMCFTQKCELVFRKTLLGFLRGVLSAQKCGWKQSGDKTYGFQDTINFACDFLGVRWRDVTVDMSQLSQKRLQGLVSGWGSPSLQSAADGWSRDELLNRLIFPAHFFLDRKYSPQTLERFDVGLCMDQSDKVLFERAVVPVYDGRCVVGVTARSTHPQCQKCQLWHSPLSLCPSPDYARFYSKWRHSPQGFHIGHYLYNARDGLKDKKVIIVEGPGCVWRLVDSGCEAVVATFGSKLTDPQQTLLEVAGIREVYCGYDNDEAGERGFMEMQKSLGRVCRVKRLNPPAHDFGSCESSDLREFLVKVGFST